MTECKITKEMAKCCAEDKAEIYHCTKFEMTFCIEGLEEYFDIW